MYFAALPPEVNSGRMYAGPGSGTLLAAAVAWDGLAATLHSAASSYRSEIAGLTAGPWAGPSSAAMAAAAGSYVAWARTTAARAEQTAGQARAAAAAYETAFAEIVPPPVIAANRGLLAALVATNVFGQNTPAIATTEAQYAEMWAQDAAAMYGYTASSVSATTLTPFSVPPHASNSGGVAAQAAAVAQATGIPAGSAQNVVMSAQQALAAVPTALSGLANPAQAAPLTALDLLNATGSVVAILIDAPLTPLGAPSLAYDVIGALTGIHTDEIVSRWAGLEPWPGTAAVPPTPFPVVTNLGNPELSAQVGQANSVGGLSVPRGWTTVMPVVRPLAVTLPAAGAEVSAEGAGRLFSQMALAGMAGRAMAGPGNAAQREQAGASTRKPPEQPQAPAGGPITGIAAELRELASLRDAGILTDD
ncbi:MAG: PPE family protein, partial [Mycobacterium sp.]|nr:PPE family protein [Mycobacterium sp.]